MSSIEVDKKHEGSVTVHSESEIMALVKAMNIGSMFMVALPKHSHRGMTVERTGEHTWNVAPLRMRGRDTDLDKTVREITLQTISHSYPITFHPVKKPL